MRCGKYLSSIFLVLLLCACGGKGDSTNLGDDLSSLDGDGSTSDVAISSDCLTTVPGRVFIENPFNESGNPSLAPTSDLSSLGTSVTIAGLDGSCRLVSAEFSILSDEFFPGDIATVTNESLNFSSGDPRFDQVMAYYYANKTAEHLESLGASLSGFQNLSIDAHCDALANAYYSPSAQTVCLGYVPVSGSVDVYTSNDGDVIVHEISHAFNDFFASNSILRSSSEAGALNEGTADYWATTINDDAEVGEWFFEGLFSILSNPAAFADLLRDAEDNNQYPSTMVYEVHDDGRPILESMFAIRTALGSSVSDQLLLNAMQTLPANIRYSEVVNRVRSVASDIGLSASNRNTVDVILANKGLHRTDLASEVAISGSNHQ